MRFAVYSDWRFDALFDLLCTALGCRNCAARNGSPPLANRSMCPGFPVFTVLEFPDPDVIVVSGRARNTETSASLTQFNHTIVEPDMNRNQPILVLLCLVISLMSGSIFCTPSAGETSSATITSELQHLCADAPFPMSPPPLPLFPDRTFDIHTYGAVADGMTLNTQAITKAISACTAAGGGTVLVPPGTWRTGPIELKSNVRLHLDRGSFLLLSNRVEDFPMIPKPGNGRGFIVAPPIFANGANNIAITGEGIIDGAGERWRYVLHEKQTERQWRELVASGGVLSADGKEWWPSRAAMDGRRYLDSLDGLKQSSTLPQYEQAKEFLRPDLVYLYRCNTILLDGPTFRNSPRYHLHPVQCENIVIRNVFVQTDWFAMNGDGIDLSSCRNVVVYRSTLDVGDDGLCIKPASIGPHQTPGPSCAKILIADCTVYHAHGGFVIGSESYGGVRDLSVRNCTFINTDVGIRFKSARGRGGVVERVFIDGVQMRNMMTEAILLDMYYSGGAPEVESAKDRSVRTAAPLADRTPQFRDISIRNVVCDGAARAILINGLPELPITNIILDSVTVTSNQGVLIIDAEGITLNGCSIQAQTGPVLIVNEGRKITVSGGRWATPAGTPVRVEGAGSAEIRFKGLQPQLEYRSGAKPGSVLSQ
jgi:polygalacturonase